MAVLHRELTLEKRALGLYSIHLINTNVVIVTSFVLLESINGEGIVQVLSCNLQLATPGSRDCANPSPHRQKRLQPPHHSVTSIQTPHMWPLLVAPRLSMAASRLRVVKAKQCSRQLSARRTPSLQTLSALRNLLGDRLSTARSVLEQHGTDESYHDVTPPDAVAFVTSTDEVSEVMKICAATSTPVIAFGAGTSIEGHISAVAGGVSINLSGMNEILRLDRENMSIKVEAGVTREQLNADLRATGLFFPVDPGANATIGGMVATNASGTTTVKYGNMKTNVLSLTAVMADGRVIKTGSKTRKSSAGYDLTRLLIGAEGTLAVVTEIELRLCGVPGAEKAMICSFDSMKDTIDTCTAIMQMGIPVARMEMMDENVVDAVNKFCNLNNPLRPSLIIEHHGSAKEIEQQSNVVQEIARDFGAKGIEVATSAEDRKRLWSGRHSVWYAVLNQVPGSRGFSADVAVPFSKLTDAVVETQQDLKDSGLIGTIVGHVGDGNFHVLIPFTDENKEHLERMKAFAHRLVKRALDCGGTCTGEHGVGIGKMDYLPMEHGEAVNVMHTIKRALDPLDILNPGKIFYGKTRL